MTIKTTFRKGSLVKPTWTKQFGIIVASNKTVFETEYKVKWFGNYAAGSTFFRSYELELLSQ